MVAFLTYIYFQLLKIAANFNTKARKLVQGERNAFEHIAQNINKNASYIWFHAASLGEFEQGRPIIEKIKTEQPEKKIILTFFSPSGYEVRKNYDHADIVSYLPFATKKNARKFVELVRPEKAIFIKYEFWANYLTALNENQTPTYIIASIFNPKQVFFKWYGKSYRKCLNLFTHLFVQNESSVQLLAKYNIKNTTICGDPRFDRMKTVSEGASSNELIEQFIEKSPVLIAGSSWGADEELLVRYHRERGNFKLILVPHEIHPEHLQAISQLTDGKMLRYTQANEQNINSQNCLVIDTMGMLSSLYKYATLAYVGGGFGKGIHNTVEAAIYGIPVVFGPKYDKFREAHDLITCQGGFSIKNYEELSDTLDKLFENPKYYGANAQNYVNGELGASQIIYDAIMNNNNTK